MSRTIIFCRDSCQSLIEIRLQFAPGSLFALTCDLGPRPNDQTSKTAAFAFVSEIQKEFCCSPRTRYQISKIQFSNPRCSLRPQLITASRPHCTQTLQGYSGTLHSQIQGQVINVIQIGSILEFSHVGICARQIRPAVLFLTVGVYTLGRLRKRWCSNAMKIMMLSLRQ